MGADEVQTKGDPKRGRRYFCFNLIMIIVLSLWVIGSSDYAYNKYKAYRGEGTADAKDETETEAETSADTD